MGSKNRLNNCRVCGLYLGDDYYPWGKDGVTPTYDICLCCGAEFGFDDGDVEEVVQYRNQWLKKGGEWSYPEYKPKEWILEAQLKEIPDGFK